MIGREKETPKQTVRRFFFSIGVVRDIRISVLDFLSSGFARKYLEMLIPRTQAYVSRTYVRACMIMDPGWLAGWVRLGD